MTKSPREADSTKYNRVLQAMSGAGAIYVGSGASKSQMVVTGDLLGGSPLKSVLEPYLCEGTPLAGILSRNGGFVLFWNRESETDSLSEALGAGSENVLWDAAKGVFGGGTDLWPGDYVFGQFLLLVNLGKIKLPVNAGKVFCPFCGEHHEPAGEVTECPRLDDDFARFSATIALH